MINNVKYDNPKAIILHNGKVIREVDLSRDDEFNVNGVLDVAVKDGKIGVVKADCPNQICVNTGFIDGAVPIICLPNKIEIKIENE